MTRLRRAPRYPLSPGMPRRCSFCGGHDFVGAEYQAFGELEGARGFECATCDAIVLVEPIARSDDARGAVRLASGARAALRVARAAAAVAYWVHEAPTRRAVH